jgi:hypothetical protein
MIALRYRRAIALVTAVQIVGSSTVALVALLTSHPFHDALLAIVLAPQFFAGLFLYAPALVLWTVYRLACWAQVVPARFAR